MASRRSRASQTRRAGANGTGICTFGRSSKGQAYVHEFFIFSIGEESTLASKFLGNHDAARFLLEYDFSAYRNNVANGGTTQLNEATQLRIFAARSRSTYVGFSDSVQTMQALQILCAVRCDATRKALALRVRLCLASIAQSEFANSQVQSRRIVFWKCN